MAWLKAAHIAALLVWCGGLIYLPGLLLAHPHAIDHQDFARVRRASRFAFAGITSPAAFLAIATGGALIFAGGVFDEWLFAKLAFVAVMAVVHIQFGHVLTKLSQRDEDPPRRRLLALVALLAGAMGAVLFLVLAKPGPLAPRLPEWMLRPGGLQSSFERIIPI